ncbi:MAG: pseudouridine synthase [bacterium]|nr:MAG: pseudouridine synthase [bacterium]
MKAAKRRSTESPPTKGIRLHKILAEAGIFSRRKAELAIENGHVAVNGKVITRLGFSADPTRDRITCDGKTVKTAPKVYILLNKPKGILTSCADDRGRKTVVDIIKQINARIFPVGRLDFNTTGILLLTNDGDFAHAMMHPSSGIIKTYLAKVRGSVTQKTLKKMLTGITIQGVRYRFKSVKTERSSPKNTYLKIEMTEGKKHLVKKLCKTLGYPVSKLSRVAYGHLKTGVLAPGDYRHLSKKEVRTLFALADRPKTIMVNNPRKQRFSSNLK